MESSWQTCDAVRLSVQIDNTAVIFCCGSNTLRVRWLVFMIYILSCVVHKFFFPAGDFIVHQHLDFSLFGPDHHALLPHAAHHIKRVHRTSPKGKFQDVLRHSFLQRLFQVVGDLEEPVGGAQAADTLVGALVIIVRNPEGGSLYRLIEAVKLRTLEEFVLDRLPEPLDFAQRHRMVRTRADVLDAVFFHLPFEAGLQIIGERRRAMEWMSAASAFMTFAGFFFESDFEQIALERLSIQFGNSGAGF